MFKTSKKIVVIGSPVKGTAIGLKKVNDAVFSDRIVGDGIAVLPEDNLICAPCDGKITQIFHTNHAFSVLDESGLEILVHIGLNTVELGGEGFKRLKQVGDDVFMGQPVMEVDFSYLESMGKESVTPVLITNMEKVAKITAVKGSVGTSDKIMSITVRQK